MDEYEIYTNPGLYTGTVEPCQHITLLNVKEISIEKKHPEYVETLKVYCQVCKKVFRIRIAVN